ncbi:MAG: hypothetical protein KC535_04610, partial [Nanoarchaeota archaeon]|nr:hypothetical protein [Nanoarchaeota archaeon]
LMDYTTINSPSALPERFSSTSRIMDYSLVSKELGSITMIDSPYYLQESSQSGVLVKQEQKKEISLTFLL